VTLKNRIVSSGHDTAMAHDGLVSDQMVAYHRARAAGEAGLIVLQVSGVHATARYTAGMLMLPGDDLYPRTARAAAAVARLGHSSRSCHRRRLGTSDYRRRGLVRAALRRGPRPRN
jgi:2,4-dienoyl-CoA reductase-like NADH-dependent reductase (Old Yellow Enzyme family)